MEENETREPGRVLKVDLEDLQMAFDNASYEMSHYLDLETGDVIMETEESRQYAEELLDEWDPDGATDLETFLQEIGTPDWMVDSVRESMRIEEGFGSRYIRVPQADSSEGYRDMELFAETVKDERLERQLWRALEGKGAFRRFKDVLLEYPQERERWFKFKRDRLEQRVRDWLESEGIEPIFE
jgi:hypothetical protein